MLARKPGAGTAKTGVDFIQNQQHLMLVAQAAKQRQEFRGRDVYSTAGLDRFDEEGSRDWKGIGRKGGYDTAEFTADISGRKSHCITVQRYTNAAYMGYKRHVIGTGCAIGELSTVYEVLGKIGAPGD